MDMMVPVANSDQTTTITTRDDATSLNNENDAVCVTSSVNGENIVIVDNTTYDDNDTGTTMCDDKEDNINDVKHSRATCPT